MINIYGDVCTLYIYIIIYNILHILYIRNQIQKLSNKWQILKTYYDKIVSDLFLKKNIFLYKSLSIQRTILHSTKFYRRPDSVINMKISSMTVHIHINVS